MKDNGTQVLDLDEARRLLIGQTITDVEFAEAGYVVIRTATTRIYADDPSIYTNR